MFKFLQKEAVVQKPMQYFAWVEDSSLQEGDVAKILPLSSVLASPKEAGFLKKKKTGTVLKIAEDGSFFETKNTVYVRKTVPYLNALIAGKIPTLTEELQKDDNAQ